MSYLAVLYGVFLSFRRTLSSYLFTCVFVFIRIFSEMIWWAFAALFLHLQSIWTGMTESDVF